MQLAAGFKPATALNQVGFAGFARSRVGWCMPTCRNRLAPLRQPNCMCLVKSASIATLHSFWIALFLFCRKAKRELEVLEQRIACITQVWAMPFCDGDADGGDLVVTLPVYHMRRFCTACSSTCSAQNLCTCMMRSCGALAEPSYPVAHVTSI